MVKKVTKEDIDLVKLLNADFVYKKRTITVTTTTSNSNTTSTKIIATVIKLPVTPQ